MLDIEALADENEAVAGLTAFAIVATAGLVALGAALGGEGGTAIFESSACDEVATSDAWYLQCVSDLF